MKSHAIVLAAGASSRLGFPKALASLDGRPLLRAHLEALSSVCTSVRVVTGAHAERLRPHLGGAVECHNAGWHQSEMRHSILCGLQGLADESKILLLPVDCPPQKPELLQRLLDSAHPAALGHGGQPGHPIAAEAGWLSKAALAGPIRSTLTGVALVEAPPSCLLNLNSQAEWIEWRGEPPLLWVG
jgi:CTP:molybdopterin cytidylyltransferase MocA